MLFPLIDIPRGTGSVNDRSAIIKKMVVMQGLKNNRRICVNDVSLPADVKDTRIDP